MIYEAKVLGASAVLLICAILSDEELLEYGKIARSLGLSALVEAHDEREVERALRVEHGIIGVNNRDLKTYTVDCRNSVRLRKMVPDDRLFVSESGIRTAEDIAVLRQNGTDAVLIGETLMRNPDKAAALRALRG
jgi:indole-3-glycerol phosphate synthase